MRRATAKGIDLIKLFESYSPNVYRCPAGFETIGYGHVVKGNENFSEGVTVDVAAELLKQDSTKVRKLKEIEELKEKWNFEHL